MLGSPISFVVRAVGEFLVRLSLLAVSLSCLLLAASRASEPPAASAATLAAKATEVRPLAPGFRAPTAVLRAADGTAVDLAKLYAAKTTVVVFYRGSWCPYCNRQLAALAEIEPQLLAAGAQIVAISPDTAEGLAKMSEKNHLSYQLVSDRDMVVASAFGVAFRMPADNEKSYRAKGVPLASIPGSAEGAWLPVPSVFVVGRDGVVRFAHSDPDFKVRLAPAAVLAAVKP